MGLNPVKRSIGHTFPILGARETLHMRRKAPWGSKRRGHHPIICDGRPTDLWAIIHLGKKLRTHVGEDPRAGQVWKKKPDNGPKVNKDLEELPYINDFTTSLLHSSSLGGDIHTLALRVCVSALPLC